MAKFEPSQVRADILIFFVLPLVFSSHYLDLPRLASHSPRTFASALHTLGHSHHFILATSQTVRYSALVGGIGYGILRRRTLQAKEDIKAAHAEYKRKEQLIQKAKQAYKDRLVAQQTNSGGTYNIRSTQAFIPIATLQHANIIGQGAGWRITPCSRCTVLCQGAVERYSLALTQDWLERPLGHGGKTTAAARFCMLLSQVCCSAWQRRNISMRYYFSGCRQRIAHAFTKKTQQQLLFSIIGSFAAGSTRRPT